MLKIQIKGVKWSLIGMSRKASQPELLLLQRAAHAAESALSSAAPQRLQPSATHVWSLAKM